MFKNPKAFLKHNHSWPMDHLQKHRRFCSGRWQREVGRCRRPQTVPGSIAMWFVALIPFPCNCSILQANGGRNFEMILEVLLLQKTRVCDQVHLTSTANHRIQVIQALKRQIQGHQGGRAGGIHRHTDTLQAQAERDPIRRDAGLKRQAIFDQIFEIFEMILNRFCRKGPNSNI